MTKTFIVDWQLAKLMIYLSGVKLLVIYLPTTGSIAREDKPRRAERQFNN